MCRDFLQSNEDCCGLHICIHKHYMNGFVLAKKSQNMQLIFETHGSGEFSLLKVFKFETKSESEDHLSIHNIQLK